MYTNIMVEFKNMLKDLEGFGVVLISNGDRPNLLGTLSKIAMRENWNIIGTKSWKGQNNCLIIGKADFNEINNIWKNKKERVIWVVDVPTYSQLKSVPLADEWIKEHMWDSNPNSRVIVI